MKSAFFLLLVVLFIFLSVATLPVVAQEASKKTSTKTSGKASAKQSAKSGASSANPHVRLFNPETMPKPVSAYSHVAEITGGKLVFIAGQVGNDASGQVVSAEFRAQVEQAFKNVKAAVEATGGTMSSVVKVNYYCAETVDASLLGAVREVRDRYIDMAHPPTSTFVVVKRLARPEYLIEIEAVAVVE